MLNKPEAVRKASNKLSTLRSLQGAGVGIPLFTTDKEEAQEWARDYNVYCRLLLTAKGGQGIIVADHPDMVYNAPLYTKAVDVKREFRVHVFDGEVIDFTEKKKRRGVDSNAYIRNYDGGWVFCREGIELPDNVRQGAVDGVVALGLDFGAVDICLDSNGDYYIFEINTAPGLQGSSITRYVEAIYEACTCS
jgi:glutathione synthase/RimK-type ligase-like ATP-grasp enzyme